MELVYVNIKDNHCKVWGFDCFINNTGGAEVTYYWGRIGVPMQKLQKKKKVFSSYWEARDHYWDKMREKEQKGYKTMPNWQYFGIINEGKPLYQLIGLISCIQREQDGN